MQNYIWNPQNSLMAIMIPWNTAIFCGFLNSNSPIDRAECKSNNRKNAVFCILLCGRHSQNSTTEPN